MSYTAVGSKFNVNESTIYIKKGVYKQKYIWNKIMYWLLKGT